MDLNATLNNVVICFIVPPPQELPHSSWRAIVYTKNQPVKTFYGTRTLPTSIEPYHALMTQVLSDPDNIPAHIIQLTEKDQYVYIEGEVCEIISTEIHLADGYNDPYIRKYHTSPEKSSSFSSSLIIPGQPVQASSDMTQQIISTANPQAATIGSNIPVDLTDVYIVDLYFKTHEVKDPELRDHVKKVAWSHGLKL